MPQPDLASAGFRLRCCRLLLTLLGASCLLLLPVVHSWAACPIERVAGHSVLRVHLAETCTPAEREAQAVKAEEVLAALAGGQSVDLLGVVILGDLSFETMPARAPEHLSVPDDVAPLVKTRHPSALHVVEGGLRVQDSTVRGVIKSNMREALLLVRGEVTLRGTAFEQSVDWSRTVFLGAVDLADATLDQQGFFIEGVFAGPARFSGASFEGHSRFHKAHFMGPASFQRARFNGLAEFLEVVFEQGAKFTDAQFKMGTGFSGSRFADVADFAGTVFEREAFFAFATFARDAIFRRATFRADANFSEAVFHGADDFSKAVFNGQPRFTRAKTSGGPPARSGFQDARVLYVLAALLLAGSLVFLFVLKKK